MFAHPDPDTGEMIYPQLELVRLAIPRRVYTQSHLDYVLRAMCYPRLPRAIKRVPFTYAPELMRHFTARFEPL